VGAQPYLFIYLFINYGGRGAQPYLFIYLLIMGGGGHNLINNDDGTTICSLFLI